jgi:membrane peptidoglycan carboxypeptidase
VRTLRRRAGAVYAGTAARLTLIIIAAALLLAAAIFPVLGITGIAVRDAANTFITLQVGKLGAAPLRSVLLDAEDQPVAYFYPYDVYRVPVAFNKIAPVMRNAIIAIEDDSFYSQGALDPRGTLRAIVSTGSGAQRQGASTIAQQYVKNVKVLQAGNNVNAREAAVYPDLRRKIQQLRLAIDVEHELTPQQLLASYLNVAYFDNNANGVQVAAQVYFSKSASSLTLPEAALLAGIVQSPTQYDPFTHPVAAMQRRTEVLARMAQLHYISNATALATEKLPLGLKRSYAPVTAGCATPSHANTGFFCDYVEHVLKLDYPAIWNQIQSSGGLAIHTTLNMKDQRAANHAVNYVESPNRSALNPNHNADTEVLLQPGTGYVRAIAENRTYGPTGTFIDYAVNSQYGGDPIGVQTGSSSKIFTLITALKQGLPFGHTIKVKAPASVGPFATCNGQSVAASVFNNAEGPSNGTEVWQMAEATALSINLYFVNLENEVGLCNVVKTAVDMGMTRADGTSLMKWAHDPALGRNGLPAYDVSSFTLGAVGVSPMSMAAAYASVAARGMYCSPDAITGVEVMTTHQQLPVRKPACRRDMSKGVADAANYILQGTLTQPGATAANRSIPGYVHVAAKTGTANSGYYAAFAGYTPRLVSYTSVFNPVSPQKHPMVGPYDACYRDVPQLGGFQCPGQMFGDMAPGATWEETFMHAALGPDVPFVYPPSSFFSEGNGWGAPKTIGGPKKGKGSPPGKGGPPGKGPGTTASPPPTH